MVQIASSQFFDLFDEVFRVAEQSHQGIAALDEEGLISVWFSHPSCQKMTKAVPLASAAISM